VTGVWKELRFLFDTDDGSLPEVRVTDLSRDGLATGYAFLRWQAQVAPGVAFWHRTLNREEQLDAWPDAAWLVATQEADVFHFLARGIAIDGVILPDLGVFVFPDELALDYRMGPEWDERRVLALFELLRQLAALDPQARVRLDRGILPEVERRFLAAWSAYCHERGEVAAVSERQWRDSTEPNALLYLLRAAGKLSERKARLFAVTACRRILPLIADERSRMAIRVAEEYADGGVTDEARRSAEAEAEAVRAAAQAVYDSEVDDSTYAESDAVIAQGWRLLVAADAAAAVRATLFPSAEIAAGEAARMARSAATWAAEAAKWSAGLGRERDNDRTCGERLPQAELLRCIFGNPYHRVALDPLLWTWNDGAIPRLAAAAYEQVLPQGMLDGGRLAVLADALEEAGFASELLAHLRGNEPHVRGCHVLDLILGRA
jgi:hypothetical protein